MLAAAAPAAAGKYEDWENWGTASQIARDTRTKAWKANLALGGGLAPEYPGSGDYAPVAIPVIDLEYRDRIFFSTVRGIGVDIAGDEKLAIGPRITFDMGRDSSDSDRLAGLADVGFGVEVGAYAEIYLYSFRVKADVRYDVADGHGGLLASADLAYAARISPRAILVFGINGSVMDGGYAESYFGVNGSTAGLDPFVAEAGLRDVGAYVQANFLLGSGFYLAFDLRANALLGDASKSPLAEEDVTVFGGAMLGYRF